MAVQKWGKSRLSAESPKGFAVYGVPLGDNLKPSGQAMIVWVGNMRRDTSMEQQFGGRNMALVLEPDPKQPRATGAGTWIAILDIGRANEMLDDFQAFQQENMAADARSVAGRPNYGKKGNARLIMPSDGDV